MPQTAYLTPTYIGDVGSSGVFRLDLSSLGLTTVRSIVIRDDNRISGGTGAASGFDLDFITLSNSLTSTASTAASLVGLSVFNFTSGVTYQRGYMQAWSSGQDAGWNRSYLYGTTPAGGYVSSIATLGVRDGTDVSEAGSISLGEGGYIIISLTQAVSTAGLYLYFGDAGGGNDGTFVVVSDQPTVPLDTGIVLTGTSGNDVIRLGTGTNASLGTGDDTIAGSGGNDTIDAGPGLDRLTGNSGIDILTGGAGNDVFIDTIAGLNGDTITDLSVGDRIIFSDAVLASFTVSFANGIMTYTGGSLNYSGTWTTASFQVGAATGGGVQVSIIPTETANDFNGDGRADVLWRNTNGDVTNWLGQANGGFVGNATNAYNNPGAGWSIAGTGDFNGDGRDDILWRNTGGFITNWLGQTSGGFAGNAANAYSNPGAGWSVAGTGDFNGDGRDDVLWRNANGAVTNWLGQANGGFAGNIANSYNNPGTGWSVAGTGDFNGDGRDDVLWRNTAGDVTNWLGQANGNFVGNAASSYNNPGAGWSVAGTGDFNGDGRDDVLWRHTSGIVTNWLGQANGGFAGNAANVFVNPGAGWSVFGTDDYNGDGRDDVLWRNTNGDVTNWLGQANGGFIGNAGYAYNNPGAGWTIQADPFL